MLRNINQELAPYMRYKKITKRTPEGAQRAFWSKFGKMEQPFMRCKTCGKNIPKDNNLIQQHFMKFHAVNTQVNKREVGFDIAPAWLNPRTII